ncbi:MAG: sensor histidine kinase [Haloplanus sp.]
MAFPLEVLLAGLTAAVSVGYVAFGVWTVRRYDGLGVRGLSTFAAVWGCNFLLSSAVIAIIASYGVTSGADLGSLTVPPTVQLFLVSTAPLSGLLTVAAIFSWLWFVLTYTTRLDRLDKVGIVGVGLVVFLVTALNGLVGALSSVGYIAPEPTLENQFHRFASTVEVLGTGVAVGAGSAQLYQSSRRHPPFTRAAFAGLSLSVLLPYLARYVYQFGLVVEFSAVELLRSTSLLIGLVGLLAAVVRYDVFEQLPASQVVGRETAFDATGTPIVVLDAERRVADINPAAATLFGVSTDAAVGAPVGRLLPETVDADVLCAPGSTTFRFPNSDRVVEGMTTATTDDAGREIGRTIVCNDITDERRRQQRIQVLNRALRHNLRNELTAARGYVEMAGDDGSGAYADRALGILDDLAAMGDKARGIEELLAADAEADEPAALADIVGRAVADVRESHGDVVVTETVPDDVRVTVSPIVLQAVVRELVENAVVHADSADVRVAFDADAGAVVVSDAGPGIPDYETEVLDIEVETSLKHGSGLGLWLVKWGVDRFGGSVRFDTDGDGTSAVVAIPPDFVTGAAA